MAPRIRPIALGLIEHQGHLFVSRGRDLKTDEVFYRFLGGGIDFGETSQDALVREFAEELQADLRDIEYLTCLDNIFTLEGKSKHELIQLFRCRFVDETFYQLQRRFPYIEGDRTSDAFWIPQSRVLTGELRLVPESCIPYLSEASP